MRDDADAAPVTVSGLCSVNDCSPWTSMAGLNEPSAANGPAPFISLRRDSTTTIEGRACCSTPCEFSVVNSSSKPVGSVMPAPTPNA